MGKFVSVALIGMGIVIYWASRAALAYGPAISSSDPLAFERRAYMYLGSFVGPALILLGFVLGGVIWRRSPRIAKPPLASFDDLPSRTPSRELRTEDDDRRDRP